MKKFTVISLLLVLVAGFAFAAGLETYVTTDYAVSAKFTKDNLNGIYFDGDVTVGATEGYVDVNFDADVDYGRRADKNFVNGKYSYGKGGDVFHFIPSLNFAYTAEKFHGTASATLKLGKTGDGISAIKAADFTKSLDFYGKATYATELKNTANIVLVGLEEDIEFEHNDKYTSITTANAAYYVPTAENKKLYKPDFKFAATADATATYKIDGVLEAGYKPELEGNIGLEYIRAAKFGGKFDLLGNIYLVGKEYFEGDVKATYTYKAVKGENKKDVLDAKAVAGWKTISKKGVTRADKLTVDLTLAVPYLLPVELIENMSLNFPTKFVINYTYTNNADAFSFTKDNANELNYFNFKATTDVFYADFDGSKKVLDQGIKNCDVYVAYGNNAYFSKDLKTAGTHKYNIGAGVSVGLDKATFALDYARTEGADGTVTLSYTKAY